MGIKFINYSFVLIGIAIGVILSLQIRARSSDFGKLPYTQLETQKELMGSFSAEQEKLKKNLEEIEVSLKAAEAIIEKRSSRQLQNTLARLKQRAGIDNVKGAGIKITLIDHPNAENSAFSNMNENFVQTADIRDIVNSLFLQDAYAISINGIRVLPLTPIQPIFDSILIGNVRTGSPFIINAIGNANSLRSAAMVLANRKIQVYADEVDAIEISPSSVILRTPEYLSLKETPQKP